MKYVPKLIGICFAILMVQSATWAVDLTWANSGTDYNAGASWSGTAPGASDAAVFNAAALTQPNLSASLTNQQVRFSTAGASGYTLSATPGASLTLTNTGSGTAAALSSYNTSGTNTVSAPIILGAAAGSTQYVTMANNGTLHVSGNISELNSGITLQLNPGAGDVIRLSGNNTFTGGLNISPAGGNSVLEVGSDTAIPTSGTFTIIQNNTLTIRPSGATIRTIAMPFAINTFRPLTFARDAALSSGATVFTGAGTLGANTTVFAGSGNTVVFEGSIGEDATSRNFTQNSGGSIGSTQGYVFLMGANTWTGTTTLNQGGNGGTTFTVAKRLANAGTADSLGANTGANSAVAVPGGSGAGSVVRYVGGQTSSDRAWNWGVAANTNPLPMSFDASGSGALTLNGTLNVLGNPGSGASFTKTLTFDGVSAADNTFAGVIGDPTEGAPTTKTAVTKRGLGTWVLSGANTFTGGISVGLQDGPSGGKLVLDYATNPTVVSSANAVPLGGGTLEFKAHPTSATSQTLGNVTLAQRGGGVSELLFTRPDTGTLTVNAGTVSRSSSSNDGRNALFIDNAAGATLSGTMPVSGNGVQNGVARWAVIADASGTGFLTESGGSLVRYTSATTLANNSNSGTTNFKHDGTDLTLTSGNKTYNSLAVDTTGGGTLTVNAGNNINPQSLLFTGSGNFTITGGQIYLGVTGDNYFHQYADGVVTIASDVSGFYLLTKTGPGTLVLSGNKTADNFLTILEGALRADHASVLNTFTTNKYITLAGGGVLELGAVGNFSGTVGTAAGNVKWTGDGGFSAFGADRTVSLNSGASIAWGSANFVPANNALVLGGRDSNAMIDFQNGLDFGFQQRVVRVIDGSAAVDARLSGTLTGNYGGGLIKDGTGTLELTGTNTYFGDTWVRAGTLLVNGSITSDTTVNSGATLGGTGAIVLASGKSVTVNAGGTLTGALTVTGGGTVISGTHSPGNSPGIDNHVNLTYNAGADVEWELIANGIGTRGVAFDGINVAGDLTFAGATTLDLVFNLAESNVAWGNAFWNASHLGADGWLIYAVEGTTSGFDNLSLNVIDWLDGNGATLSSLQPKGEFLLYLDGNDIYLNYALIPEPASAALLGLAGLALLRRRGRSA